MYLSVLTALTFAGAREDLSRVEIDTLTALSTWSGVKQIDVDVRRIASRSHYSEDATKKALASLEDKNLIVREARFSGGERLTSIIYVDWRSALAEQHYDDYDRIADAGDGSLNFPASRENNPHMWGDEPAASAGTAPKKEVTKTVRNTIIPDDWRPSEEQLARTLSRYPSIPLEYELENFVDYYSSRNVKRANWDAVWRRWCAKGNEFAKGAWAQQPALAQGAQVAQPTSSGRTSGDDPTKQDFYEACIAHNVDYTGIINFWQPHMGLPGDPGWPHWEAQLNRHCGKA